MKVLLDTNILLRSGQSTHPHFRAALDSVNKLMIAGDQLFLLPQILYEFWSVATRPIEANGLNMTTLDTHAKLQELCSTFEVVHDTPELLNVWTQLVLKHDVKGKLSHDARLVSAMSVHGIAALLTFNDSDFKRFPGITVLTPQAVLNS